MVASNSALRRGAFMPKTIEPQRIEAAKVRLRQLPEKPKVPRPLPLSQAIREIKAEVQVALKRGYTFDEIAQSLKEDGIDIGTPTLKSYVYRGTKRRTNGTKAKPKTAIASEPQKERTGAKAVEMPAEL